MSSIYQHQSRFYAAARQRGLTKRQAWRWLTYNHMDVPTSSADWDWATAYILKLPEDYEFNTKVSLGGSKHDANVRILVVTTIVVVLFIIYAASTVQR